MTRKMDDNELVRIKMGELRRLQKCDHEVRALRTENQRLHAALDKLNKGAQEIIGSLQRSLNEIDKEREKNGHTDTGRNGPDRKGEKVPQGRQTAGGENHSEEREEGTATKTGPEYPCC